MIASTAALCLLSLLYCRIDNAMQALCISSEGILQFHYENNADVFRVLLRISPYTWAAMGVAVCISASVFGAATSVNLLDSLCIVAV